LIVRLSALGDVVCTLPVAVALRHKYPEAEIVWACDPRFAGIAECCTAVDRVVRLKPGLAPRSWMADPVGFDLALDMQGLLKSAVVAARARAKQTLGYHWQREGAWLFSSRVLPDPTSVHIVDQYVDVARAAGVEADRADFGLSPHPDDVQRVDDWLRESGVQGRFIVMNAGAGWATKRWPPAGFAAVADWLANRGIWSVFIGGKADADRQAFEEVARAAKSDDKVVSAIGATSVRELVALLAGAAGHIGGDTGSSHLAAALGIPAIGLYSITRPERSCPYGQVERCLYDPGGLAAIQPDSVIRHLSTIL